MDLKARRAELQGHLEQLIGQANRATGAISILDELLKEEEEKAAEREAETKSAGDWWRNAAPDAPTEPEPTPLHVVMPDGDYTTHIQPEMPAVVPEFEACDLCDPANYCPELNRCVRGRPLSS